MLTKNRKLRKENNMITTKDRAKLKAISQNLRPVLNIGKENLNENSIVEIENYLRKNEIMKIKLLNSSEEDPKELMSLICEKLGAEPVLVVGKTLIIYKFSKQKGVKHVL